MFREDWSLIPPSNNPFRGLLAGIVIGVVLLMLLYLLTWMVYGSN